MPNLNALGIVVRDMAETIRFYRLLGVDVPETPGEGPSADVGLAGVRRHRERESGAQRSGASGDEEKPPWDAFWGQHYAQLRDPNGVGVDLYASLE